ncbi:MAG TPA: efflux RND transporter periplasmic adaptor subunit [Puia sp.]|nr:efflux RND transporter periplasmic adaptor subunit [Puia sp.]
MNKVFLSLLFASSLMTYSCSSGGNELEKKKAELQKLKDQQSDLSKKIQQAEDELDKLDTASAKKEKTKLVAVGTVKPTPFTHYIDLQGKVDALNIAYVTPANGQGGQVKAIYVKQGDVVKKGQLLLKLDDVLLRRQLDQAKIQVGFAQDLYNRRDNLWKENIGTEVDLIDAKNKLDLANKQVDFLNQQIQMTNVYADISGVADQVNVRIGEIFTGNNQIRIVNTDDLKAVVQVPEAYLGKVTVGTRIKVVIPELNNRTIDARVSVVGKTIDPSNRSFYVEAKLPYDKAFYPNQVAMIKIQDYSSPTALTVPINSLQNDEKGKYVMVAGQQGSRLVAVKKPVTIGHAYGDSVEVLSGIQTGDKVITEGYQGLYDQQPITTQVQ